jgi:pentatricopeptide repeat protein
VRPRTLPQEMKAAGLQPRRATFDAAVNALGLRRQWERMEATMQEMRAADLNPSADAYDALINFYLYGALAVVQRFRKNGAWAGDELTRPVRFARRFPSPGA